MNHRGFDRIAEDFLADGPTVLADRVFAAALDEVHLTRQRRVVWRTRWRFPNMSTFSKFAVAAVVVIAVGYLGLTFLGPSGTGTGGGPSAVPSATVAPTATPTPTPTPTPSPVPTAPPLTGQFTSPSHGYAISYPEGWSPRPASAPWTSGVVDFFNEGSDLLAPGDPGNPFLALASQPLGDRTRVEWEADVWQILVDDDPGTAVCSSAAEPITIDGAPGISACNTALVTDGGRGYVVMLWLSSDDPRDAEVYDDAWFASVLSTMELHPEDAIDAAASPSPS